MNLIEKVAKIKQQGYSWNLGVKLAKQLTYLTEDEINVKLKGEYLNFLDLMFKTFRMITTEHFWNTFSKENQEQILLILNEMEVYSDLTEIKNRRKEEIMKICGTSKDQKFQRGQIVKIAEDLGKHKNHFTKNCFAIIKSNAKEQYGNNYNSEEYTLFLLEQVDTVSWYNGSDLRLATKEEIDILKSAGLLEGWNG